MSEKQCISVASLNVRRIVSPRRIELICDFVRNRNIDVVALQEVCFSELPLTIKDYKLVSNVHPDHGGTAFLFKAISNSALNRP